MRVIALAAAVALSGCTIGNGNICGPQTPRAYCDKEAYQRLMYPAPHGVKWIKEGMTRESRRSDSWACGAANTIYAADRVVFPEEDIQSARRPEDKDDFPALRRLTQQWRACMQSKGYTPLQECDARCLHP